MADALSTGIHLVRCSAMDEDRGIIDMITAACAHRTGNMERVQEDATAARRAALDAFLRGAERRALRMAELATRNIDDALELVQEAMLGFVRNYASRPETEWPPLFYRVLDSRLLDFHRRQTVRQRWWAPLRFSSGREDDEEGLDEVALAAADEGPQQPWQRLQGDQALADLSAALRGLPDRQRQAFLLRHWEGFDGATTARIMGCSEGSVKTHLSRALAQLRERLEEHR